MYKVIIADDEPNIRNGLAQAIKWESLDMAVAGVARDGEETIELIDSVKPDICLLDIRMPFHDGLEIAARVKETKPDTILIFISGHDEFEYAQNALKLKAYDYILKPVNLDLIEQVLKRAKNELEEKKEREKKYAIANIMLKKNLPVIRHEFLLEWLRGELSEEEINEGRSFYQIDLGSTAGILVLKTNLSIAYDQKNTEKEKQLLLFAIQHVVEDCIKGCKPNITVRDNNDYIVSIVSVDNYPLWENLKHSIEENVKRELNCEVIAYQSLIDKNRYPLEISDVYLELLLKMRSESEYLPTVKKLKEYADSNYKDPQLRLQDYAEQQQISLSHLSKLFKQETGISFVDYLTKVRLQHAIVLMQDSLMKIYEIADLTGYSSQHYFCVAFKKVFGMSPTEYRKSSL